MQPRSETVLASGLRAAHRLLADLDFGHVVLMTDTVDERPEELAQVLEECLGSLSTDVRGIGTNWSVRQLQDIASALLGTLDIVADPDGVPRELCGLVARWAGKAVANPFLRIWTPDARVRFVKQVAPTEVDLTGQFTRPGRDTHDYPLGIWGEESRDYHLCIELPAARKPGIEVLAAAVGLIRPDASGNDETVAQRLLSVHWLADKHLENHREFPQGAPHLGGSAGGTPSPTAR